MEEKELQELERALQAATPAPWRASRTGMGRSRVAAPLQVRTLGGEVVSTEDACNAAVCADHEDAAAIAALRNAAPSLISDLREARATLADIATACEDKDLRYFGRARPEVALRIIDYIHGAASAARGNAGASPPPDFSSESAELREARRLLGESANGLRGLLCLPHPPDRDSRRVVEIAGDTLAAVDTFLEEGSDCEQSEPNRSENGKD